jgi:creatinine amidohydrolase
MASVRTAELSWRMVEEARDRGAAIIVPMGSTEEHGPHSPTGDYLITDAIAEAVARETGDLVAPTIPFSYSEYFRHYPGTITVQAETLRLLLRDVVGSLLDQGFRRVILFNGHNGNGPILQTLIREFRRERGLLIPVVAPLGFAQSPALMRELYGDNPIGHGGEPVGSMMTYLRPELVDVGRAEDWGTQPFLGQATAALSGITFQGHQVMLAVNMEDVTPPSGSLSDPHLASRERGERLVTHAIEDLIAFVRWFKTVDPTVEP